LLARLILLAVVLVLAAGGGTGWASFPGENGTIVYRWTSANKYVGSPSSIRAVDPRTARTRVLRDCPLRTEAPPFYPDCELQTPRYSPDGARIAFHSVRIAYPPNGPWQITRALTVITSDGASLAESPAVGLPHRLAWSPDGNSFLVEREATVSQSAIFLTSADGSEVTQVTPTGTWEPDWSVTGWIAFTAPRAPCRLNCTDLYVTRLGGTPRRLTYRGGNSASWSPHGTKLAFVRLAKGRQNIYVIRRDGRGLRQLTRRGGYAPAWSPDGRWMAFLRAGDIYVVRTSGRGLRRLVNEPPLDPVYGLGPQVTSVDWQPLQR
jgi:Tol biopolymer transport system component